jgi:translation initiation factor 2D
LYPTVFALWKIPVMLPQVVIHSPVSTFVLRGADLMAPGIYKLDNIHKGDKVSIRVRNNPFPFAIGLSEVDTVEEFSSCLTRPKGKAVQVLHSFGDMLWKGAPASIPNNGFLALTVVTAEDQCASSDDDDDDYDEKDSVDDGDGGNDIDKADNMGGARSIDYDCDELMVENQSTENGVVCIENLSINVDEDNDPTGLSGAT